MVEVKDKKKTTEVYEDCLSATFNQRFKFDLKDLKIEELEEMVIKFSVLDSGFFSTDIIGTYEMDLTSVYF